MCQSPSKRGWTLHILYSSIYKDMFNYLRLIRVMLEVEENKNPFFPSVFCSLGAKRLKGESGLTPLLSQRSFLHDVLIFELSKCCHSTGTHGSELVLTFTLTASDFSHYSRKLQNATFYWLCQFPALPQWTAIVMISMFIYERTSAFVHVVRPGMCKSYRKTHVKGGSAVVTVVHCKPDFHDNSPEKWQHCIRTVFITSETHKSSIHTLLVFR